jgi:hypothetical protein
VTDTRDADALVWRRTHGDWPPGYTPSAQNGEQGDGYDAAAYDALATGHGTPLREQLPFSMLTLGELGRLVDAAPPARYVVRHLLVDSDYGVIGASKKFGKTFVAGDLAVNVAAGGCVLGAWPVDHPGVVLLFAGEGGRRKLVRRGRAIAAFYGHDLAALPVYVHERSPKLGDLAQVERLRLTIEQHCPRLVILDPSYLALAGADTRNLASIGALLERAQIICQDAGAALVLTHHWNKTGTGASADRFTGAGFAEWGRVLISGEVRSSRTDALTKRSSVLCKLEIIGDELADTEITFRRDVWVDDPDDLASPMHYRVQLVDAGDLPDEADLDLADDTKLKPSTKRVLVVLRRAAPAWLDAHGIGDKLADGSFPLKSRTIYEACKALVELDLAVVSGGTNGIVTTWAAK